MNFLPNTLQIFLALHYLKLKPSNFMYIFVFCKFYVKLYPHIFSFFFPQNDVFVPDPIGVLKYLNVF